MSRASIDPPNARWRDLLPEGFSGRDYQPTDNAWRQDRGPQPMIGILQRKKDAHSPFWQIAAVYDWTAAQWYAHEPLKFLPESTHLVAFSSLETMWQLGAAETIARKVREAFSEE